MASPRRHSAYSSQSQYSSTSPARVRTSSRSSQGGYRSPSRYATEGMDYPDTVEEEEYPENVEYEEYEEPVVTRNSISHKTIPASHRRKRDRFRQNFPFEAKHLMYLLVAIIVLWSSWHGFQNRGIINNKLASATSSIPGVSNLFRGHHDAKVYGEIFNHGAKTNVRKLKKRVRKLSGRRDDFGTVIADLVGSYEHLKDLPGLLSKRKEDIASNLIQLAPQNETIRKQLKDSTSVAIRSLQSHEQEISGLVNTVTDLTRHTLRELNRLQEDGPGPLISLSDRISTLFGGKKHTIESSLDAELQVLTTEIEKAVKKRAKEVFDHRTQLKGLETSFDNVIKLFAGGNPRLELGDSKSYWKEIIRKSVGEKKDLEVIISKFVDFSTLVQNGNTVLEDNAKRIAQLAESLSTLKSDETKPALKRVAGAIDFLTAAGTTIEKAGIVAARKAVKKE